MTEQEKREKVIRGMAACMPQTEEEATISCAGCPYNGNPCGGDYQDNDHVNLPIAMVEDIRSLLKAQEPKVMTLAEALGSEECWLERKDGNVTVADIALNGQDSGGYDVDSNELSTMRRYIFHSGYYGKYWRCWTSRPTDEQREATPWES